MIRFLTAGESHGKCLVGILEGMPAGLEVSEEEIARDLKRRQFGYGRGERMKIEQDRAQILAGVRYGRTLGSPLALLIENSDWPNWKERMPAEAVSDEKRAPRLTSPRPGHADLAGAIKYHHDDIRNVIERSSARETAMRVALAAVCRKFLREFGITVGSHVVRIGAAVSTYDISALPPEEISDRADRSPVRCLDGQTEQRMTGIIDEAKAKGDTVGGVFEVIAAGLPVGLGSYVHYDRRLDGLLAQAMMSIPAIKAVGFGLAEETAQRFGSEVHDRMFPAKGGLTRKTNNAGGLEGGMTNGEPLRIRVTMKPLSTLGQALESVDLATGNPVTALHERSDVCAVPAAAIVGEAMAILALMNPFLEKYGGDSMQEIKAHVAAARGSPWV